MLSNGFLFCVFKRLVTREPDAAYFKATVISHEGYCKATSKPRELQVFARSRAYITYKGYCKVNIIPAEGYVKASHDRI